VRGARLVAIDALGAAGAAVPLEGGQAFGHACLIWIRDGRETPARHTWFPPRPRLVSRSRRCGSTCRRASGRSRR
jgi:hypothetical protein